MSDRGTPGKPSTTEDEYFVREDAEKKRKLAFDLKHQMEHAEQERLKQLHWMHCPKCGMQMHEVRLQHQEKARNKAAKPAEEKPHDAPAEAGGTP